MKFVLQVMVEVLPLQENILLTTNFSVKKKILVTSKGIIL